MSTKDAVLQYYQRSYGDSGFAAQRRFPNEELCRFMGRNFFGLDMETRKCTRIVEVGSGSGANLWMIAREGFDAVGIELSIAANELCRQMLDSYGTSADLITGSMTELPFDVGSIDAVVDVFSSYCLNASEAESFLGETARVLKPGGRFFSYFPSKVSDSWQTYDPVTHIDSDTLRGIQRETSPYFGNAYAFRFLLPEEYRAQLQLAGLDLTYLETLSRTYRNGAERFEFVVIEATKPDLSG